MIELTIGMNTSRAAKMRFHVERLLPMLRATGCRYYVERAVAGVPIFRCYVDAPDGLADDLRNQVQAAVDAFLGSLDDEERQPAASYGDMWRDIRKIHRLGRVSVAAHGRAETAIVSYIQRRGEYFRVEDMERFNHFLFEVQPLMERTMEYLDADRRKREVLFVFGLFGVTAPLFQVGGQPAGYLSFKSHVIGFFSYKHPGLPKYAAAFDQVYMRAAQQLNTLLDMAMAVTPAREPGDGQLLALLANWRDVLMRLNDALRGARDVKQDSLRRSWRAQLDYRRFRKLSRFHADAFSAQNVAVLDSYEFGAYRMCVNFAYLLLPTLGISSRKRVEAAYLLVRTLEHPANFLSDVGGSR